MLCWVQISGTSNTLYVLLHNVSVRGSVRLERDRKCVDCITTSTRHNGRIVGTPSSTVHCTAILHVLYHV